MIPGPTWSKLTPDDRAIWNKLSDQTKTLILNARSWGDTKKPLPAPNFKPKRKVNLHDLIQACQHMTLEDIDDQPNDHVNETEGNGSDETAIGEVEGEADLLTYVTNRQTTDDIPAAHLAKMLSNTINRYSKKKKTGYKVSACFHRS
jgi:hypothetical protein